METRRKLLEHLLIITILFSSATSMHLVILQKLSEHRNPVEQQVDYEEVPELLILTSPDLRAPNASEAQFNAVKLWFSRFPPFLERVVQFIQNRFSTYNNVGMYPEIIYEDPYPSTATSSSTTSPSTTSPSTTSPSTTSPSTTTTATSTITTTATSSLPVSALTVESDEQTEVTENSTIENEERGT